jgi:hypothetical protein
MDCGAEEEKEEDRFPSSGEKFRRYLHRWIHQKGQILIITTDPVSKTLCSSEDEQVQKLLNPNPLELEQKHIQRSVNTHKLLEISGII